MPKRGETNRSMAVSSMVGANRSDLTALRVTSGALAPLPECFGRELGGNAPPSHTALAERVNQRITRVTPTITLAAYLRWWLDVDLVEQVEDGLITATTRISYINPITGRPATSSNRSARSDSAT